MTMQDDQMKDELNHYLGICESCGEAYEAQSVTEDLEGVSFICKKSLCEGSVSLRSNFEDAEVSFVGTEGFAPISAGPRRYC